MEVQSEPTELLAYVVSPLRRRSWVYLTGKTSPRICWSGRRGVEAVAGGVEEADGVPGAMAVVSQVAKWLM